MTYREAHDRAAEMLSAAGVENETLESRLLLEHITGMDTAQYRLRWEDEMPAEDERDFFALVRKRCARIPLQHLTGEQEFMGLTFAVNGDVMIPRQDTETLAEAAIRILTGPEVPAGGAVRVLDLCTGSGCLAISLLFFCPQVEMYAADVSEAALAVAAQNAAMHHADVTWIHSDLFDDVPGDFFMIVCNPPYIPTDEIDTLMPEVRDHDPRLALDGGADGLEVYRRIVPESASRLLPGGWLLLEIGAEQGAAVSEMMREVGYTQVEVIPDLAGLDRVVIGRIPNHV